MAFHSCIFKIQLFHVRQVLKQLTGEAHELRWFLLPSEAIDLYKKRTTFEQIKKSPFIIRNKIPSNSNPTVNVDDEAVRLLKVWVVIFCLLWRETVLKPAHSLSLIGTGQTKWLSNPKGLKSKQQQVKRRRQPVNLMFLCRKSSPNSKRKKKHQSVQEGSLDCNSQVF